jgi:hypothetical protein
MQRTRDKLGRNGSSQVASRSSPTFGEGRPWMSVADIDAHEAAESALAGRSEKAP